MKNLILTTGLGLLVAGATLPELPPTKVPVPQVPVPQPQVPVPQPQVIPYKPERIGLIRTNEGSGWVNLIRPVGASDTCNRTTFQAVKGEQWTSSEGPNYVAVGDGTWVQYREPPTVTAPTVTAPTVIYATTTGYATTPNLPNGNGSSGMGTRVFYRPRWGFRKR